MYPCHGALQSHRGLMARVLCLEGRFCTLRERPHNKSLQPTALSRIVLKLASHLERVFCSFIRRFSRAAAELPSLGGLGRSVPLLQFFTMEDR